MGARGLRVLENIIDKYRKKNPNSSVQLGVSSSEIEWQSGPNSPYFIASTTKLYTTAIVFRLVDLKKIGFQTRIVDVLESKLLDGLHCLRGRNHVCEINVYHLLTHTSGLPDYFEQRPPGERSLADQILANHDRSWSFEETLDITKRMKPHFPPGACRKAFYSDTNFQLLGRIIEKVSGKSFSENLDEHILSKIEAKETFLFDQTCRHRFSEIDPIFQGNTSLTVPLAMASFDCDGGIVSTVGETLSFMRGFQNGVFFDAAPLPDWRRIFFPLQYGVGMMRFKLPRFLDPFNTNPELFGHSGASGAFVFYCPTDNLYLAGTVNRTDQRSMPYRLMPEVIAALRRHS